MSMFITVLLTIGVIFNIVVGGNRLLIALFSIVLGMYLTKMMGW